MLTCGKDTFFFSDILIINKHENNINTILLRKLYLNESILATNNVTKALKEKWSSTLVPPRKWEVFNKQPHLDILSKLPVHLHILF